MFHLYLLGFSLYATLNMALPIPIIFYLIKLKKAIAGKENIYKQATSRTISLDMMSSLTGAESKIEVLDLSMKEVMK
jgi:hypothetical protein